MIKGITDVTDISLVCILKPLYIVTGSGVQKNEPRHSHPYVRSSE